MKIIGITGGVGSGKSEVLRLLSESCSCFVLKADEAAHLVKKKGTDCYKKLVTLMSADILAEDGQIDKAKMASRIFSDKELLDKVNSVIHPAVKEYILDLIEDKRNEDKYDYFFIEAALLIEDGYENICDELWYVYASVETRFMRLKASRDYPDGKIRAIMSAQLSEEEFRRHCRRVIDNDGDRDRTLESLRDALKHCKKG